MTSPSRHLRWKIILPFVFLSVVLGLAGTYLTTKIVTGSLGERFDNQLAETARVASDAVVRRERKQLETLRSVSLTEGVAEAVADQDQAALQRLVVPIAVNSGAERVELLTRDGRLLFGARLADPQTLRYEPIETTENYSEWSPFRRAIDGSADASGDKSSAVLQSSDGPLLYTAGPLTLDGEVVGAVLIGSPMSSVLSQAKLEALGDITVYDAGGEPLASSFALGSNQDERLTSAGRALAAVAAGQTVRQHVTLFNRSYDLLYGRLTLRGSEPVLFSVALPSSFIASAADLSRGKMTVLFLAAVMIVMLIGWGIARSITNPVLRLARTASAVSSGDLSARSGVESNDEIGHLARTFDMMTSHLQRQHLATIKALVSAIDARDPYTMGHSLRVGQLSTLLGRKLELPAVALQHLEIGGYLHDIGKIGVRDHVLLKPGILDTEEREMIQSHPRIGLEIIESINFPIPVQEVVVGHHEKLDGSGYPYQLRGDEISIFSRIAAIADIYDALTTDRPYRDAMEPSNALEILDREALAGLLDRPVVDAMASLVSEWESRILIDASLKSHKMMLARAS